MNYRVVRKKLHKVQCTVISQPLSRGFTKLLMKITVYQSIQNFYQLVKYSSINSWNWIHVNTKGVHRNGNSHSHRIPMGMGVVSGY